MTYTHQTAGMTLATANAGKLGGGTGGFTSYNLVVP